MTGLFLFSKFSSSKNRADIKPSQFDFSKKNSRSDSKPIIATTPTNAAERLELSTHLIDENKVKWDVFEDILHTKNDNDPRLDQDLKNLSPEFHMALIEKYSKIPPENRNGKGLIVFLIARDLTGPDDFQFLKSIYEEKPCLSLIDCNKIGNDDPHHAGANQTTLVYPQQVGLFLLEKRLQENPELLNQEGFRNEMTQVLVQAENFPVPAIQEKARALRKKYGL